MNPDQSERRGILARGNWIVDRPKTIDVYPVQDSLANILRDASSNWRDALIVVQPKTLIRWHRAGFRLLWHWKSKPGRPPIPAELRRLIREMSRDNSLWGQECLPLKRRVTPSEV